MDPLLIFSLCLLVIGTLFHIAGIYAISKSKDKSGYGAILVNLSVSQLVIILQQGTEIVATLTGKPYRGTAVETFVEILWYIGGPESIITMIVMLLDRVLLVVSPFQYKDTGKRSYYLIVALTTSWFFSFVISFTLICTNFNRTRNRLFVTYICVTSVYIGLAVISYSVIITKVNRRQQSRQHVINGFNAYRLYRMTGLMVGSCILFNFLPMCLYAYRQEWERYTDVVYFMDLILDPCIYIFYNGTYRAAILPRKVRRRRKSKGLETSRVKKNSFDIYFVTKREERKISARNFLSFSNGDVTGCTGCNLNKDQSSNTLGAENPVFTGVISSEAIAPQL